MTLVKWTPKKNMFNLFDEVEQMMQQAFGHSLANKESDTSYSPLLNVSETDNEYLVTLDLPGVEKKDVNVSMNNNILTISGERRISDKGEEDIHIWHETGHGAFCRSFELSTNIIENKIKAKFSNGVLNISIPKAEEIKPPVKKITVS